jgi:hypothetical protein
MNATTGSPNVTIPAVVLDIQTQLIAYVALATDYFYKIPGSAIILRYIRSSYQDDPVRSAVELVLFLFFVRYLLAPKYSTRDTGRGGKVEVKLSEEEVNELVDDWTPEPLVAPLTALEENEHDKRPVIIGYCTSDLPKFTVTG